VITTAGVAKAWQLQVTALPSASVWEKSFLNKKNVFLKPHHHQSLCFTRAAAVKLRPILGDPPGYHTEVGQSWGLVVTVSCAVPSTVLSPGSIGPPSPRTARVQHLTSQMVRLRPWASCLKKKMCSLLQPQRRVDICIYNIIYIYIYIYIQFAMNTL
jgi:hypothetical protein